MALDDFLDPEVGAAVAATTLVLSSRARSVLHKGAVMSVAGALAAGEAVASFGRGVARGWRTPRVHDALPSSEPSQGENTNGASAAQDRQTEVMSR